MGFVTSLTIVTCVVYWRHIGWNALDSSMSWYRFSETLLKEKRFESTIAPLTTIYYALWMAVLGKTVTAVRIAALAAFAANNVLVFCIARQLSGKKCYAFWVTFFAAFHPFLVFETNTSGYEILSILFIDLYIYFVLLFYKNRRILNAIWIGIVCGAAALIKAALVSLAIIFIFYCLILFFREKNIRILKYLFMSLLVYAVIVGSWMTRNRMTEGYFAMADPTYMAWAVFHGNNPWATKGFPIFENDCPPEFWDIKARIFQLNDPSQIARSFRTEVTDFIRSDPFYWSVILGFKKLWCAFKFYSREEILYWGPIVPLAIAGLFTLARQGVQTCILHLILLNYVLSSYLYFGFSRYRIPYIMVLLFLSCHALIYFKDKLKPSFYYLGISFYLFVFWGGYFFAKVLRAIWQYSIPQLRM